MFRSSSRPAYGIPDWIRVSPFPSGLVMPPRHGAEQVQLSVLLLMVFSGAFVVLDILYNVMSLVAIGLFTLLGLRIDQRNMPLVLFLVVFNLAGLMAMQPYLDLKDSTEFMLGTCFVAVTAIFFAVALNENALARLEMIKWGLIMGGLAAASAAILGMNLGAAGGDHGGGGADAAQFTMYGRASGTFRDPNVLGSFLVMPAIYLVHDILRAPRISYIRIALLGPIVLGLFLTYSRGSWAAFIIGMIILITLEYITALKQAMRSKVVLLTMIGVVAFACAMAVILSIESIRNVFLDRFTLQKDYDSGPSGRFGNQARSIPELLGLPWGYGPNRFWLFYPENPHNTYLNAFSSYGWLGGITFLTFIVCTFWMSLRTAFARTPFQGHAIVLFASLVPHLVQNFQIDTDRWRHLFMIYGLIWGVAAISRRWLEEYRAYAISRYQQQQTFAGTPNPAPAE